MRQWRLIYDSPTSGPRNMAIDEAILQAVVHYQVPPTLRFYRWSPPCLSLGYGQKVTDVDRERLAVYGWELVRRPTGGRAILHIDELTYSVALPADDPLAAGSIIDSYRQISRALVAGLQKLGVSPQADRRAEHGEHKRGPVCFETPSHYEITVAGRKLIGSAQMRRHGGVLQHGTLPLEGDIARICDGLNYDDEAQRKQARNQVGTRAITLAEALGQAVTWQSAADALAEGFAEMFDIDFGAGPVGLTEDEHQVAEQLADEVYASAGLSPLNL
jgi:lipoyl(octanoyl) transferase